MIGYNPDNAVVISSSRLDRVTRFSYDGVKYTRKEFIYPHIGGLRFDYLARHLCARQVNTLNRVKGVDGLQQIVEQDSPTSFISKFESGKPINQGGKLLNRNYFDKLFGLMQTMYDKGVVLLDLRYSNGLLVGEDGNPKIVGFGAAFTYDPAINSKRWKKYFDYLFNQSLSTVAKRESNLLLNEEREHIRDLRRTTGKAAAAAAIGWAISSFLRRDNKSRDE